MTGTHTTLFQGKLKVDSCAPFPLSARHACRGRQYMYRWTKVCIGRQRKQNRRDRAIVRPQESRTGTSSAALCFSPPRNASLEQVGPDSPAQSTVSPWLRGSSLCSAGRRTFPMKASRQQPPMPCLSDDNASGIAPNLEDSWTFLENAGHDRSTTSRVVPAEERRPAAKQEGDGEEYADLSPFITAPIKCEASDGASHFDADADVPLPRSHVEVVKARRLKSEAGRRRARLQSSEVGE